MSNSTVQPNLPWGSHPPLSCAQTNGEGASCWLLKHVAELADRADDMTDQLLSVCWNCPTFAEIKERAIGSQALGRMVLAMLDRLVQAVRRRKDGSAHAREQVSILEEISTQIEQQGDLEETLRLILTGITAGESLGFNRAFLFLVEESTQTLQGQMAVGPADAEEAGRVWRWISEQGLTLKEMMQRRIDNGGQGDHIWTEQTRNVEIALTNPHSVLAQAVREQTTLCVTDRSDRYLFPALVGATHFVVVPLLSKGRAIGAILADNRYSGHPITDRDIHRLEALACLASVAIENHRLSAELRRNVAELKQAYHDLRDHQARLIQSERMVAVGQVTAVIAHEIKNPLVSIGGLARFMRKGIPPDHPHSEHLSAIANEVTRLETLIRDILDFSHSKELHRVPVHLNEMVEHTLVLMSKQLDESCIQTKLRLDDAVPAVPLDRNRMHQVLVNLFQNAAHAMSEGGTLSVCTRRTETGIELEVTDTGMGISAEAADRLFEPFFTTKPRGSGLGLAICQSIVERHGGHIEVVQRDPGTSFIVHVPVGGL